MASSDIFSYKEAARQSFDFACHLLQHRERLLVGQTLQRHSAGIEKDLNLLLFDDTDALPIYLFEHTARHVSRIGEVIGRMQKHLPDRVGLLRFYGYPTFDADIASEAGRCQTDNPGSRGR